MGYIYLGCTNAQIGEKAGITENTVKKHVYNIYEKLDLENRTQLVKFVIGNKLEGIWKTDEAGQSV
jgi:DNA-binding NarL/FixJ family response regulator